MNENIKKLIDLATQNPDLPIVAMVNGDVVGNGWYDCWKGFFGDCYIAEYYEDEEGIVFRPDELPDRPATKAIIVNIDLYESGGDDNDKS